MSRPWLLWSWIPLLVFAGLLYHGATLGLTDDEAYYWVLGKEPALGYAYHPPMIAWLIGLSSRIFGDNEAAVRLPAALCAASSVLLALYWMDAAGAHARRLGKGALALLSFAGFFGLAWMSVPDLPLFLGWMLAFSSTWEICFSSPHHRLKWNYPMLGAGVAVALLSKYSGVLVAISALWALRLWAAPVLRPRAYLAVAIGLIVAAVPIVAWNSQHHWVSILYQIKGRHEGAGLSWIRYARFWAVELAVAGPGLVLFAILLLRRAERPLRFITVWLVPAAGVFCVQPLFSDFKPHWAFIVWWPAALALGWSYACGNVRFDRRLARLQGVYGLVLMTVILASCRFPLQAWIMGKYFYDPRMDVTNDLYGWRLLPGYLREELGPDAENLPVVGSRYQTAAQAAFALKDSSRVTLVPRELRSRDEWPALPALAESGQPWPELRSKVIYVDDIRYDQGPAFPNGDCVSLGKIKEFRGPYLAKWIEVWACKPR